jgi:hypothetical protein
MTSSVRASHSWQGFQPSLLTGGRLPCVMAAPSLLSHGFTIPRSQHRKDGRFLVSENCRPSTYAAEGHDVYGRLPNTTRADSGSRIGHRLKGA